jgi:hypothetical protein
MVRQSVQQLPKPLAASHGQRKARRIFKMNTRTYVPSSAQVVLLR